MSLEEHKEQRDKDPQLINKDELKEAELEEILESVPPERRKDIEKMMILSSTQMRSISSPETAVMKKLTSEHISKYLEGAELEMKNSYTEKLHKKVFMLLSMIIILVFFVVIVILLKDNPDVMEKVLYAVGGAAFGSLGGYGFGKTKNSE